MNNPYFDSDLTTPSAVGTMEVITPSNKPVIDTVADLDQQVEFAQTTTEPISQRGAVDAESKGRRWYQRLLEIAADNPPHPV